VRADLGGFALTQAGGRSAAEGDFRCFADAHLANRIDLLIGVPGIGERGAIALLIRSPGAGSLSREKVAALAGLDILKLCAAVESNRAHS